MLSRFLSLFVLVGTSFAQTVIPPTVEVWPEGKIPGNGAKEPEAEVPVRRRFERSRRHWLEDYLPLADEWGAWDNQAPPAIQIASSQTRSLEQLHTMLDSRKLQETPPGELSEMAKVVLEASRVVTEKMLEYYRRMGIEVTPEMTLAPETPKR